MRKKTRTDRTELVAESHGRKPLPDWFLRLKVDDPEKKEFLTRSEMAHRAGIELGTLTKTFYGWLEPDDLRQVIFVDGIGAGPQEAIYYTKRINKLVDEYKKGKMWRPLRTKAERELEAAQRREMREKMRLEKDKRKKDVKVIKEKRKKDADSAKKRAKSAARSPKVKADEVESLSESQLRAMLANVQAQLLAMQSQSSKSAPKKSKSKTTVKETAKKSTSKKSKKKSTATARDVKEDAPKSRRSRVS